MNDSQIAVETIKKLEEALRCLDAINQQLDIFFVSNVVRDGVIRIPPGVDASRAFGPNAEKKRLGGFILSLRFGGHGGIAAKACATLAGQNNVETFIATKIFRNDARDLIDRNLIQEVEAKGSRGVRTGFVVYDGSDTQSFNVVVEQDGDNTILRGVQPNHSLAELAERASDKLQTADVLGFLSLRSQIFRDFIKAVKEGRLGFSGLLFSDCTSGSDVSDDLQMLEILESARAGNSSLISLLSINECEALRLAKLLSIPAQERKKIQNAYYASLIQALESPEQPPSSRDVKLLLDLHGAPVLQKEAERIRRDFESHGKNFEDASKAAEFLFRQLRVPLLLHTKKFSRIISNASSKKIPSLKINARRSIGAGDTLCGAVALALAVKKRLEDVQAPIRLSIEECLLIATLATCFRLEAVEESFPTMQELKQFAEQKQFNSQLPDLDSKQPAQQRQDTPKLRLVKNLNPPRQPTNTTFKRPALSLTETHRPKPQSTHATYKRPALPLTEIRQHQQTSTTQALAPRGRRLAIK